MSLNQKINTKKIDPVIVFFNLFTIICYLIFIFSIKIKFISINELDWYNLGMGKYIGLFAIIGIYCIFRRNYFAAFFISLFAAFFCVHEVIIFYDNYAIELGRELGDDGLYRSVIDIFFVEVFKNPRIGAFWAISSSVFSLLLVTIAWIKNIINKNDLISNFK